MSHPRRSEMHGVFDALVAATAADVAGHGLADLVARGFWIVHQQRRRLHDLAGLAEAALRDVELAPGLLYRVIAGRVQPFDGGDVAAGGVGNRGDAGAHRLLVDDDGAGAAQRLAAAEFGAGQPDLVADEPDEWKIRIAVPVLLLSINLQLDHDCPSLFLSC